MNRAARTPPLPPREYSGNAKRSLRMALDLADVTVAQFAEALGEHEDTVSAWCSPSRCNQVPLWVLAHPRCPAKVREHLLAACAESAGEALPVGAHTPEAQANVVTGGVGDLLAHLATALLDQRIGAHEAEGLLPRVRGLRASLQSFERHCVALLADEGW